MALEIPTEAQWEYACRGGTCTAYYTGDSVASLAGYENFGDHESDPRPEVPELATVGRYLPNPFGLHDMHGNVREWCEDFGVQRAYFTIPARAGDGLRYLPTIFTAGGGLGHICRGQTSRWDGIHARSSARLEMGGYAAGVRPARAVETAHSR